MSKGTSPRPDYKAGADGKCPHCGTVVHFDAPERLRSNRGAWYYDVELATQSGGDHVYAYLSRCPSCQKPILTAEITTGRGVEVHLAHPFGIVRIVPKEVPQKISEDFLEACAVLQVSEKASAALSRRCLQNVLIDQGAPRELHLIKQIDWFLERHQLSSVAKMLDDVREIGNFAAHPMKYESTSLIVDVEPEEASWNLEVLERLFDYCYVQPAKAALQREKLNKKLSEAGKRSLGTL